MFSGGADCRHDCKRVRSFAIFPNIPFRSRRFTTRRFNRAIYIARARARAERDLVMDNTRFVYIYEYGSLRECKREEERRKF